MFLLEFKLRSKEIKEIYNDQKLFIAASQKANRFLAYKSLEITRYFEIFRSLNHSNKILKAKH